MNAFPNYGGSYMGPPPSAPPRQSSLHTGSSRLEPPYSTRTSESSSVSYDSSRRSSNDSSKPRLSKDQQSFLEREFNINQKPNTEVKKDFARRIGVSADKVNNWFQNKRAKTRNDAKKQHNQNLAYQLYYQNGGSSHPNPEHDHPYNAGFINGSAGQAHNPYPFAYSNMSAHFDNQDASVEPSLDASNLGNEDGLYTHFPFQETARAQDSYGMEPHEDDMSRFFGLSGPIQSVDNLQQQQRRFGNGVAMGTISEEVEDHQQQPHAGPPHHQPVHMNNMNVNLNDYVDPGAFEMPFDLNAYPPHNGPNATWGASAGIAEREPNRVPAPISSTNAAHLSTLPYRTAAQAPDRRTNNAELHAFHQPLQQPPFFEQPIVLSQREQPRTLAHQSSSHSIRLGPPLKEESMSQMLSPPPPDEDRRDSAVSNMVDNVGSEHAISSQHIRKAGVPASPLPVRKQRRPPPLATAMRSTSYGSTVPPSPRSFAMDANLRRIKSSGNFNGRVQKSGASSAQRSPLNPTFSHAEISRSISTQSMASLTGESWRHEGNVPMTPASPDYRVMPPSSSVPHLSSSMSMPQLHTSMSRPAMAVASQPQFASNQAPAFFSDGPLFESNYAMPETQMSPPATPSHVINNFPHNQYPMIASSQSMQAPPVPSSAPPHQQSFEQREMLDQQQPLIQGQQMFSPATDQQTQSVTYALMHPDQSTPSRAHHHLRTATAQYIGNSQQLYQQSNEPESVTESPAVVSNDEHDPYFYGHASYGYQSSQIQSSVRIASAPQTQVIDQPLQHSQYQHTQHLRRTSTGLHSQDGNAKLENGQLQQEQRPLSALHTPQPKNWPYTNPSFMAQNAQAFGTWNLNEERGRGDSSPSPPQEKQYTFFAYDGPGGAPSPDRHLAPKSAGLTSSYSKIEFCHTSPQAFREGTSSSPSVQG